VLLLAAIVSGGVTAPAQQSQPAQPQQPPPPQQPAQPAGASSTGSSSSNDLFSIDRIRKELERQPTINFSTADPNLPVYRLRIEGYRFQLPTWQQNFVLPQSSVPQPLGGADYYEMQRLITPPQAWGSAPFSNSDLVKMYGLSGAYGLAGVLIKKALDARSEAAVARARAEVQQELADLEVHNARVAAGQVDDGDPKDAARKKAAEKKKQDEEKKKKKDGGK
jgi:hypothetical protein